MFPRAHAKYSAYFILGGVLFVPALLLAIASIVLLAPGNVRGAEEESEESFLRGYLAGTYTLIGRRPGSAETYQGTVRLVSRGDRLAVTREIGGKTIAGEGRIESALGADGARVLRVRFSEDGRDYEATYLWRSDLDNYPRISGYVYQVGRETAGPGLEALFIVPERKRP